MCVFVCLCGVGEDACVGGPQRRVFVWVWVMILDGWCVCVFVLRYKRQIDKRVIYKLTDSACFCISHYHTYACCLLPSNPSSQACVCLGVSKGAGGVLCVRVCVSVCVCLSVCVCAFFGC